MKANELRIGNRVLFAEEGIEFTIRAIDKSGLAVYNETEDVWIELSAFEGIPLTAEWLLKFGFLIDMDAYCSVDTWKRFCYSKQITISCTPEKTDFRLFVNIPDDEWYSFDWVHIQYVHQLQNLYFALTGEELILKK